ncbi:hypothetical protein [Staphylococcus warneri]|uniref:hypothetical protein n=1 Tax=Staphylococcus warneri TaxID=1292 RepID=UPI0025430D4F|nr:hypothetical protein [Staphylococcus warneri]MDK4265770.1 hypothetical protein [Staphylococcus warneri]
MQNKNLLVDQLRNENLNDSKFVHPSGSEELSVNAVSSEDEVDALTHPTTYVATEVAASVIAHTLHK